MLEWLETTTLGEWVNYSLWGYPSTLATHGLGMAIVVGITAVIALRILGFARGISIGSLRALVPVMLFGLIINTLSGIALFMAGASILFYNTAFQLKMLAIVIGVALLAYLDRALLKPAAAAKASSGVETEPPTALKVCALVAILIWWVSVVLSGRLIAYMGA